jgi:hypothetical protein
VLMITAPTLHLRVTSRGDFVLYTRTPRRPRWAGRTANLHLYLTPTQSAGPMATLTNHGGGRPILLFPITRGDALQLKRAANDGRISLESVMI